MNALPTVIGAVLPVFCIAGAGFVMRKVQWLTEEADNSLLKVTVNLLMPCLILDKVANNEAVRHGSTVLLAPLVGFITIALGMGIALAAARLISLPSPAAARTFALCVGIYNYGYVPMPLAESLYDRETVGVLFVHNVGVDAALWTLGLMLLKRDRIGNGWSKVLNPPVIAIFLALLINFSGLHARLWPFLLTTARMLGQCAIPVGLILIGATIADHAAEFHSAQAWETVALSCFLRLGLLPILFLLIARALPCSVELKRVIVLQAAMPSAVFPIVMARHYQGDTSTALHVVVGTSVFGFVTMPLWIRFGARFVGI